jgi:hypothetical protein
MINLLAHLRKAFRIFIFTCFFLNLQSQDVYSFDVPGTQSFIVPSDIKAIKIETWGAGGEGGFAWKSTFPFLGTFYAKGEGGGGGAYSSLSMNVNEGDEFEIFVGAGGGNKSGGSRGGKQRGDSTYVSSIVDGNMTVIVLAKGGLPGDGALTQSNPNGGKYLRGGLASEGIGQIRFDGGNGSSYQGQNTNYNAGGGGGAAGSTGNGGHAGSPFNYSGGIGNSGGGDGGTGATTEKTDGEDGIFPGGGGGGAKNSLDATTNYGGVGGHGRVIITAYTSPLFIALKDFYAKNLEDTNLINWTTTHEDYGDVFELERSMDGKSFEKLLSMDAYGIKSGSIYNFVDEKPYAGDNFYRLNLINVDGTNYKSNIIAVKAYPRKSEVDFVYYPNPITDVLTIAVSGDLFLPAHFTVSDLNGRIIYMSEINDTGITRLNTTHWTPGIYIAQVSDYYSIKTMKIYK